MKPPKPHQLLNIMMSLDWNGQIDPGATTLSWLAREIAQRLDPDGPRKCESCGGEFEILLHTPLGNVCEECIEEFSDQMEEMKETLED